MWARFIRAMEYRSYCMAIHQLRQQGLYKEAQRISEYKYNMYPTRLIKLLREVIIASLFFILM